MLQKVTRWNSNNQISSCLLPALTSIISFCQLATASTTAKRQWRGGPQPPHSPASTPSAQTQKEMSSKGGSARREKPLRARSGQRRLGVWEGFCLEEACRCQPHRGEGFGGGGGCEGEMAKRGCRLRPCLRPSPRLQRVGAPHRRRSGGASSPLRNTQQQQRFTAPQHQQRFTAPQHQLSAPALFQTLVSGKFGGSSLPGLCSSSVSGEVCNSL